MTDVLHDLELYLPPETPPEPNGDPQGRPDAVLSPWALLGIDPDAPPELVAEACQAWTAARRAARPPAESPLERAEHLLSSLTRRLRSDADAPAENGQEPARTGIQPLDRVTLRRPATHWDERPCAHLIVASGPDEGTRIALGPRPLRIGTGPDCDVLLPCESPNRWTEARVWPHSGRYLFHALGDGGARVNGQPAIWAVLDDGDELQLAGTTFRFVVEPAPPSP